jgi:hypothetical protein
VTRPRRGAHGNTVATPRRAGFKPARTTILRLLALLALLTACSGSPTPTPAPPPIAPAPTIVAPAPSATVGLVTSTVAQVTGTIPATIVVPPSATLIPNAASCAPGVDFLGFSDGLNQTKFGNTDVGGLSALTYDAARGVYYALTDNQGTTPARFYTLRLPLNGGTLGTPAIEAVTTLRDGSGQPFTGRNFDGEGMALLPDGNLLVSSETEPSIRRFAPDGTLLGTLPVPSRFAVNPDGEATENQTFESLGVVPGGQAFFTAVEGPLAADGFTGALSARLRILRYDRAADGSFAPTAQFFYLAETAQGVADLIALSDTDLLVLERGFIPRLGNTIRVYHVSLVGATDVADRTSLSEPGLTPLKKELLVDLVNCPPNGATNPARQPNPLLDNFEALALGPTLPDGRRVLLLLSDNNFADNQVTRVIALAMH